MEISIKAQFIVFYHSLAFKTHVIWKVMKMDEVKLDAISVPLWNVLLKVDDTIG